MSVTGAQYNIVDVTLGCPVWLLWSLSVLSCVSFGVFEVRSILKTDQSFFQILGDADINVIKFLCIGKIALIALYVVLFVGRLSDDLFSTGIVISTITATSGLVIDRSRLARLAYFIAGSISWYSLKYWFISATGRIDVRQFLNPSFILAFFSYATAVLTSPCVIQLKYLKNFYVAYIGLFLLLFYFWVVEVVFIESGYDYFSNAVMKKAPPRLAEIDIFGNHHITFTLTLVLAHTLSHQLMLYYATLQKNSEDTTKFKRDDYSREDDSIVTASFTSSTELRESLRHRYSKYQNSNHNPGGGLKCSRENTCEGNSVEELPEDCVEIPLEHAFILTGEGGEFSAYESAAGEVEQQRDFDA
jgi:hypothetical protein